LHLSLVSLADFRAVADVAVTPLEDRAYYFYHYDRRVEPVRSDLLE
jgi:hypothetical protein